MMKAYSKKPAKEIMNLAPTTERRLLQAAICFFVLVPLSAGGGGMLFGTVLPGMEAGISAQSHFRYLSGLLFGIGIAFLTAVPRIETQTARCRLLTFLVVIGGLGRLAGLIIDGVPSPVMVGALGMELVVTPLLCIWQGRVAQRFLPA